MKMTFNSMYSFLHPDSQSQAWPLFLNSEISIVGACACGCVSMCAVWSACAVFVWCVYMLCV